MSKSKASLAVLLVLQVVAILIYPPSFFQRQPQAAVMPPALLILFLLAAVGYYTSSLSLEGLRSLLVFLQGINMVIRLMTLFPNLKTTEGEWEWGLLICQVLGLSLSWYLMPKLEQLSPHVFPRRSTA